MDTSAIAVPGECNSNGFAQARSRAALKEVTAAGVIDVLVNSELAFAIVMGPYEVGVLGGTDTLGAENVGTPSTSKSYTMAILRKGSPMVDCFHVPPK